MKFEIKQDTQLIPFEKKWQFCVGSGHASMALRSDYKEQLKFIHDELGIERVRFHGIFNDDMHTMDNLQDVMGIPGTERFQELSFRYIGKAYDNILDCGMKPFVELSFMPANLALDPDKKGFFFYRPIVSMPKDDDSWVQYIKAFVNFLIHRYGREEVETWFFEVWNEPDLVGPFFAGTREDYFHLYEITARAIKEIDDKIPVGGPSTSNSKWIKSFVTFCKGRDIPLDFVTTHQYAGDPLGGIEDEGGPEAEDSDAASAEKTRERDARAAKEVDDTWNNGIRNAMEKMKGLPEGSAVLPAFRIIMNDNTETDGTLNRNLMAENAAVVKKQAMGLPVYYTEWNTCATFGAEGNDTRKVASYDIKNAIKTDNIMDGSSIWCFSDIFEELHPFQEEFHGGFGMQTQSGIPKPVFYAMKMLLDAEHDRYDMPDALDGEISMAAFRGHDRIQVMLTRQELQHFAKKDADKIPATVSIEIDHEPKRITLQRIDEDHCNPYRIWCEMGRPIDMNRKEVNEIIEKSRMQTEEVKTAYTDGKLNIGAELGINDVYFYTVEL